MEKNLVIVGAGPAGLAAAIAAYDEGVREILVLEREQRTGGVLKQCVHNGFGLTRFKENLTGPEYAEKFRTEVKSRQIELRTGTFVTSIDKDKNLTVISARAIESIHAKSIILAMGCRERSRGALEIAGTRPAGVFSAGTAQKYVNEYGMLPGKKAVILGSGDIGLIMARRLTLEGTKVECVAEIMPYSSGLRRNVEQCLNDFSIPLYLSCSAVKILGEKRVEGVILAKFDANKKPIASTEFKVECDTILLSVGLVPENELSLNMGMSLDPLSKGLSVDENRQSEIEGVFACGNVLHVHDLVDFVSEEGEIAGRAAARYLREGKSDAKYVKITAGANVSYVLPQKINATKDKIKVYFRVKQPIKEGIIVVKSCNNIRKLKRGALLPGQMCSIILTAGELSEIGEIEISAQGEKMYE